MVKLNSTRLTFLAILLFSFFNSTKIHAQCSGGGPCQLCDITTTAQNITGGSGIDSISFFDENILPGEMGESSPLSFETILGESMVFDLEVEFTWQQGFRVSWMHGFSFSNINEWLVIDAYPSSRDSGWIFMDEISGKCSGRSYGPGFFWDPVGDSCPPEGNRSHWDGTNCIQQELCEGEHDFLVDGDPSDNWGFNCTTNCPSFIFQLLYIAEKRGTDTLELRFQLVEDGETGAWLNTDNCVFEVIIPVYITVHDPDFPKGAVFCQAEPTEIREVMNAETGRTWMDRNLGAERAAYFSRDRQAYGDLYQWGRFSDGHQCRDSETTTELAVDNSPGHPFFIINPDSNRDWRTSTDNDLWQRLSKTNNPCPEDFRPPTMAEWMEEVNTWTGRGTQAAIRSTLSLPLSGIRSIRGDIAHADRWGQYWSSTVSGENSQTLLFTGNTILQRSAPRAQGLSVRCIKDDGPIASVTLNKAASPAVFSNVNQIITFSFEVTNNGEAPLLDLVVTDTDFGWTFGPVDLEPGQSTTFLRAYFTTLQDILNGGISNHAEVSGFSDEGEEVFAEDEVFVPFQPQSPGLKGMTGDYPQTELRLYPNPSTGWLTIELGEFPIDQQYRLKVLNSPGQQVHTEIVKSNHTEINLTHLSPGWYLVSIFDENNLPIGRMYLIIQ